MIPCLVVGFLAACATTPASDSDNTAKPQVAKACDPPQTGTMLKRCHPSDVRTMSREEIDRDGFELPHRSSPFGPTP